MNRKSVSIANLVTVLGYTSCISVADINSRQVVGRPTAGPLTFITGAEGQGRRSSA